MNLPKGHPLKVLVVDDQAVARDMAAHALTQAGYEVITASNGREALDVLEQGTCQMVACDWEMPIMNGIQLCQAIRAGSFKGYIYIIMLTSNNRPRDTIEGLGAGADDYIFKPFSPAELIMRVNTGRRIISLETRDMAIFVMAKLADSRDPGTGDHLERVRGYCQCLAERMKAKPNHAGDNHPGEIDDYFVKLIYETSPLHDIGKVAIPDSVLLKPGQLSEEEREVMKCHTLEGAKTLRAALQAYPNASFLQMAHDIAISHHERFDGQGYPHGLAGEQIPLCGRIVAVADVYDALTSKRVYKDACGHNAARQFIASESGKQFDPRVVDAFLAVDHQFQRIRAQYSKAPDSSEPLAEATNPPVNARPLLPTGNPTSPISNADQLT